MNVTIYAVFFHRFGSHGPGHGTLNSGLTRWIRSAGRAVRSASPPFKASYRASWACAARCAMVPRRPCARARTVPSAESVPRGSGFSENLNEDRPRQRPVVFDEVGPLPASAHQLTALHGEETIHAAQDALEVVAGIESQPAVIVQIAIMPVAVTSFGRLFGRQTLQVSQHIPLQAFDALRDQQTRRGVGGHGPGEAIADTTSCNSAFNPVRDVDHLQIFARLELDAGQFHNHWAPSSSVSAFTRKIRLRHSSENPRESIAAAMFLISTRG